MKKVLFIMIAAILTVMTGIPGYAAEKLPAPTGLRFDAYYYSEMYDSETYSFTWDQVEGAEGYVLSFAAVDDDYDYGATYIQGGTRSKGSIETDYHTSSTLNMQSSGYTLTKGKTYKITVKAWTKGEVGLSNYIGSFHYNFTYGEESTIEFVPNGDDTLKAGAESQDQTADEPAESKPADAEPDKTEPARTEPAKTEPAKTESAENGTAESKSVESKPTESKSASAKKVNPMTVKAGTVKASFAKLKKKNISIAAKKAFTIKKAKGKVTFKKISGSGKVTVSKAGKITIKKKSKKGTYKIVVKVTAAGNGTYKAKSKNVKVKIIVK